MTIVSLSVRYASASIDEFIENHAPDVSARGIYIKTERDIPLGTLIDFDVRIGGNQTVLAGAGRVMWTRTTAEATPQRPAGIGVRFIELEEASTALVKRLLGSRSDAGQKYMEEPEMALSRVPTPPPSGTVIERSAPQSLPPPAPPPPRRPSSRPKAPSRAARRSLPPVAPPPRRSTVPPAPSVPPESEEDDSSDTDSTQAGFLPPMPKGRKATLVGLGAPVLPRITTPPRRRSSKPPPAPRTTPPPPKATPPPPRTSSLPPKPTPPPPRVAQAAPRPSVPSPPRAASASQPAPPPVVAADLEDAPEEPTLLHPMAALERELSPPAEAEPVPVPIDVEIDIPDAEPTVIIPADEAEPTVIVPREDPVAALAAPMEPPTEITAPQSMQEILGVEPELPRDLGDTQRIRRRGRKRRLVLAGFVVGAAGAGALAFALMRHPTYAGALPAASSVEPTAAPPPPTEPSAVPLLEVAAAEAGVEASTAEDAATSVPLEAAAPAPSSTPQEPWQPPRPSAVSTPPPVAIEFSALTIERAPPRPPPPSPSPHRAPTAELPTPTPNATPSAASTPNPPRSTPAAAPNCNPTYTVDADGNKHFKPECFK